jgi:hypothetical protein
MHDESSNTSLPSSADHVGQAAGGITGVLAGAAIGTTAGPLGTILGGIAGAIGGWWTGRALAEAAEDLTEAEDRYYRERHQRAEAARDYEVARDGYFLGDIAAANPEYSSFEEVERDLSKAWTARQGDRRQWQDVRDYASVGFQRGRERRRSPR